MLIFVIAVTIGILLTKDSVFWLKLQIIVSIIFFILMLHKWAKGDTLMDKGFDDIF